MKLLTLEELNVSIEIMAQENTAVTQGLRERLSTIDDKIASLTAHIGEEERELAHYREISRYYHRVLEFEINGLEYMPQEVEPVKDTGLPLPVSDIPYTVADAVRRVMVKHPGEKLHKAEVTDLVRHEYPHLCEKVKDMEGTVGFALHAGAKKKHWIRVRPGVFKYK